LKEAGEKISADKKKPVEDALAELNGVKNGDDLEKIKVATEKLSQEAQKIGQELYKAVQPADAPKPEGASGEPKDAEVEKDKKTEGGNPVEPTK
jgi:molecular chaperone DnaK